MQIDIKRLHKYCKQYDTYTVDMFYEQIIEPKNNNFVKVYKELQECRFCPPVIKQFFNDKCTKYLRLSQVLSPITFHIYYDALDVPLAKIIKSYKETNCLVKYFNMTKSFNIYIVMAPYKRFFPAKKNMINVEHINGGFTSILGNDIFIFRSEEFSKVILHEVLHHCPIVHSEMWTNENIISLKKEFNINKSMQLIPNESVVELWATLMHCAFLSFSYDMHFSDILNVEKQFSIMQYNKIIKKQQYASDKIWNEYTNAYCYIVFKTIMLFNLHKLDLLKLKPEYVTTFLIDNKNTIPKVTINKTKSLRMMCTSDL